VLDEMFLDIFWRRQTEIAFLKIHSFLTSSLNAQTQKFKKEKEEGGEEREREGEREKEKNGEWRES
jgi:hypothetical protein